MTERHTKGQSEQPCSLSHRQILVVIGAVMSAMFLAALDMSIVGVAMPTILSDLHGLNHLSWVVTAYLITSTAVTPLWGKFSDLHGRRLSFQLCIGTFLIGSALCGFSQEMWHMIASRALQGIGGGGLMAIALAVIGDVIAPRDRGRYQGFFGAVFGTSAVVGPLLGGWLTDSVSWRWIFWINIPFGIAAMVVIGMAFRMQVPRREHRMDYLGAAVIVASVTCLLLYLNWAGTSYGWFDPISVGLVVAAVVLAVLFVGVESRAKEPIIPLGLFSSSIFSVGGVYSFLIGMAMFGAVIFLPMYLQMAQGMDPTEAGLAMIPMVLGIATTSIITGRLVSRTGRYKIFPVVGAVLLVIAQLLLSRLHIDTPYWHLAVAAFVLGVALGCAMQTVMVAVQNAVPRQHMGAATSATMFFRLNGQAVGTGVFGAVLTSRLAHHLQEKMGAAAAGFHDVTNNMAQAQHLPEPIRSQVLQAFAQSMDDVFLAGIPIAVLALISALLLKEIPLQRSLDASSDATPDAEPDVDDEGREPVPVGATR